MDEPGALRAPREAVVAGLRAACRDVRSRAIDRLGSAHDASHYRLVPELVATPRDADEVARILAASRAHAVPVTFRSGGTSLSGQASTAGVLVDTRRHFRAVEVLADGALVRTGPGATVRAVNVRLSRHGRKLGPDPASEIACTVGGVIANNSSGMACGIDANAYRTLESVVLVLPSGTVVDTGAPDADERLRTREPAIHAGLSALRDRVRSDPASVAAVRAQYSIKNTMGYGLNSFLDHDHPVEILEHLVVGSEGTLAFVAEATLRTVPVKAHAATALLVFADLAAAASSLPALVEAGFATIELLDATSLRVAQADPEATVQLRSLAVRDHAALLVEFQEPSAVRLGRRVELAAATLATLPLAEPVALTSDPGTRARLWHIRKGLFTAVAGSRPSGTTALLEDIAVPVGRLADTCIGLTRLFEEHGYEQGVIFGHAKDGNIHFLINERFDRPESISRYRAFTEDLVRLVLDAEGTLKAEHGTGRIMAPFVRRQFGDELYDVMREVKRLLDPDGVLNPGVLLDDDPDRHVRDLKVTPTVEPEVDRCVECGYCEPACPSRDLTTTPRERIVLRREIANAVDRGDRELVRELERDYEYAAVDTCAVDGMCQTACPVLINTGDLVRRLRAENATRLERVGWATAARHWDAVSRIGGLALTVADALPSAVPAAATAVGRALLGADRVPRYTSDLPGGGRPRARVPNTWPDAVYFSSCTTTMFGPAEGSDGVAESFRRLCERAGVRLSSPAGMPSLCCGTPWKSKGLTAGYERMAELVVRELREATDGGRLPVVCDASSCTEGLRSILETAGDARMRVVDAVAFVDEVVLPRLPAASRIASLTVHPTCSSARMGITDSLLRVADVVAERVVVPDDWGCCAFAGDRGMLHPELTSSATADEARSVRMAASVEHASVNRTCELGMTRATGRSYRHLLEVLDEVTRGGH